MATNWNGLKSYDGKVSEQEFNKLVDVVHENQIVPGCNYSVTRTVGGTTLAPKGKGNGGSSGTRGLEFYIFQTGAAAEELGVRIGTINGVIPSDMYAGDIPPKHYSFPADEGYIFADATFEAETWQWVGAGIVLQEANTKANTATHAYQLMGTWTTAIGISGAKSITQEVYGPVIIPRCDINFEA